MICDLNKTQAVVDWDVLAPLLDFVIIKASGKHINGADPYYARNVAGAVSHGVPMHVFHFLYCLTEIEAKRDARLFFETVKAEGHWPLIWVLDCEAGWGIDHKKARPIAEAFEAELRRLAMDGGAGDIRVALYIGHNRYREYALDYDRYDYVWVPRYGANTGQIADSIVPDHPCDLWQYTSKGRLPGIIGDVDLSVLTGSKPMEFFTGKTKEQVNGGETLVNTRVTAAVLVQMLVEALNRGDGYIMGAYGQNPRTGYLDLNVPESQCKSSWKPTGYYFGGQYSGKQLTQALKWREKCARVWDCNGLAEGIYELQTGVCINSKARHNYAEWCGIKGTGMIPVERRVPGAAVFWSDGEASKIHHVAYLYKPVMDGKPEGDWYIIEARGVMYGVVKTKLYSRKPNFWGWMDKYFDYADQPVPVPVPSGDAPDISLLGQRTLKKGCEGEDVRQLQAALMWLGYDLGKYGADGDFGSETEKAVKAFQTDHHLTADGVMHSDDYTMLFAALNGEEIEPGPEPPTPAPVTQYVKVTGNSVNVRSAPGTTGTRILGVVHKGDKLLWQGLVSDISGTLWYMVEYKNQNGWISDKYSDLIL